MLKTLQIPRTLPTSDELLGRGGMHKQNLAAYYLENLEADTVNVLGLHAEIEGIGYQDWLRAFLRQALLRSARFPLLSEIARREHAGAPADAVVQREIPGRAGTVSCQRGVVS